MKEGYDDLFTLLSIDDDTIDELSYPDPADATKSIDLLQSDKAMIRLCRDFVLHREASGDPSAKIGCK